MFQYLHMIEKVYFAILCIFIVQPLIRHYVTCRKGVLNVLLSAKKFIALVKGEQHLRKNQEVHDAFMQSLCVCLRNVAMPLKKSAVF